VRSDESVLALCALVFDSEFIMSRALVFLFRERVNPSRATGRSAMSLPTFMRSPGFWAKGQTHCKVQTAKCKVQTDENFESCSLHFAVCSEDDGRVTVAGRRTTVIR